MKYFVLDAERKNTVYHEFQKGKFDGCTFWKSDSIYLSDDLLFSIGVEKLFTEIIPYYKSYAEIEINAKLWKKILQKAKEINGEVFLCISEADEWVKDTFSEYNEFTIIGV